MQVERNAGIFKRKAGIMIPQKTEEVVFLLSFKMFILIELCLF